MEYSHFFAYFAQCAQFPSWPILPNLISRARSMMQIKSISIFCLILPIFAYLWLQKKSRNIFHFCVIIFLNNLIGFATYFMGIKCHFYLHICPDLMITFSRMSSSLGCPVSLGCLSWVMCPVCSIRLISPVSKGCLAILHRLFCLPSFHMLPGLLCFPICLVSLAISCIANWFQMGKILILYVR